MARAKPSRPDLKTKPANDKERIDRLEYLVEKLLEANGIELDWK